MRRLLAVAVLLRADAAASASLTDGGAAMAPSHDGVRATQTDEPSTNHPRALWTPPQQRALHRNVFWSHIPKTSTTFARTFFSYTCGPAAVNFAEVDTTQAPLVHPGACTHSIAKQQDELINETAMAQAIGEATNSTWYPTWFHSPVPWSSGRVGMTPRPLANVITLVREPADRMLSEYRHIASMEGYTCCGNRDMETISGQSWGWRQLTRGAAVSSAHGKYLQFVDTETHEPKDFNTAPYTRITEHWVRDDSLNTSTARTERYIAKLANFSALYGCQTKMLVGRGCHEEYVLTARDILRARTYIASDSVFVGLSGERYNESICLFHVRFGGPLWDFEVLLPPREASSHPRNLTEPSADEVFVDNTATVEDFTFPDDPDVAIYELAERIFDHSLAQHRQQVDDCLAHVSRG